MNDKTITFELAEPKDSKDYKGSSQTVEILPGLHQRCSRCKTMVLGEPMALHLTDLVSQEDRHKAQRAVAVAMYNIEASSGERYFDQLDYSCQSKWLREAARDGWKAEDFHLDAIGLGATKAAREAGVAEAQKWPAYTDRRKVFQVSSTKLPPGWLTLSFEARGSKDGQPVQHGYVMVHVCPACAPAIFDAANVDPTEPFGNGVKW